MKWFSVRTNPAAIYLPQFITEEEQSLLYRSLRHAVGKSDNRGRASGAVDTEKGTKAFVRLDQEATIELLKSEVQGGGKLVSTIREAQEDVSDENPNRLRTWEGGRDNYSEAEWNRWWKKMAKLPPSQRKPLVIEYEKAHISKRPYANNVNSSVIGNSGRDANNSWARQSKWTTDFPYDFRRVLPILQRIDRAFKLALPQRYAIQQEYVSRIPKEFRIADTVFTTVTVNANFKTALHRDDGNLRQGFSNLLVLCNGKRYEGGHFILPEFGAEVALKPRDLIFVQNDEYLHSNTPIVHRDKDATRMSLVCYVRESFLFSGSPQYEDLRRSFVKYQKKLSEKDKVRARRWESKAWYRYLRRKLKAKRDESLLVAARRENLLNAELLYLANKWEGDPLFEPRRYQYATELAPPPRLERVGMEAVFSAIHLKTARQDQVLENSKNKQTSEDGAVFVDSLFIADVEGERWGVTYTTSESGAARFNNNRFNVQAVAPLPSLPREIEKLSRDAYEWLKSQWNRQRSVWLVSVATGIPEAPQRMAFTTISPNDHKQAAIATQLQRQRAAFQESASSLADRYFPSTPSRTAELYDLGWKRAKITEGTLQPNDASMRCEAIELTYESERSYLTEHLGHYVRRAKALNNEDYRQRYDLIGTYRSLSKPVPIPKLHQPWAWQVNKQGLTISQGKDSYTLTCTQPSKTWRSPALSALIFGAKVPNAAIRVWVHKEPSGGRTGQVTATDGAAFWLFQSTSRLGYIGANEVKTYAEKGSHKKITRPVLIRHAQRQNPIAPLNEKLLKRIRRLPTNRISVIPKTPKARAEAIENFQIAIPSYGRSGMIADFTLKMLERYNVDPKRVTIFVADDRTRKLWVEDKIKRKSKPDDHEKYEYATRDDGSRERKVWVRRSKELEEFSDAVLYKKRLKNNPYGQRIVVGEKGIGPQRNFIQRYYPEGTHLLSIDDDLTGLFELMLNAKVTKEGKLRDEGVDVGGKEFHAIIRKAFEECHRRDSHLFGFFASNERNQGPAVRRALIDTKPCYIIASMYGKIVRRSDDLKVRMLNHAEDQERTLRFLAKDGVIVRLNKYSVNKGTSYLSLGGIQDARQKASRKLKKGKPRFKREIKSLVEEFKQYCSPIVPKGKDTWELRWRSRGGRKTSETNAVGQ